MSPFTYPDGVVKTSGDFVNCTSEREENRDQRNTLVSVENSHFTNTHILLKIISNSLYVIPTGYFACSHNVTYGFFAFIICKVVNAT